MYIKITDLKPSNPKDRLLLAACAILSIKNDGLPEVEFNEIIELANFLYPIAHGFTEESAEFAEEDLEKLFPDDEKTGRSIPGYRKPRERDEAKVPAYDMDAVYQVNEKAIFVLSEGLCAVNCVIREVRNKMLTKKYSIRLENDSRDYLDAVSPRNLRKLYE